MSTTTHAALTREDVLTAPQWLEDHLDDPAVHVVEVDVSRAAYDDGHIPGAVLWNVYADVKDAAYQSVGAAEIERLVSRSGIAEESTVVLYGYAPALGFWLLRRYGHADVRILECSRGKWRDDDRPWTTAVPSVAATPYRLPPPDERLRADRSAVLAAIGDPTRAIVDVRTIAEFRGERFWPSGTPEPAGRAGHVPSAISLPIDGLIDEHGAYQGEVELARLFAPVDLAGDGEIITYCTVGGRAATAWFALTHLLGREHVRVYDGSWADWGHAPSTPVERAEERVPSPEHPHQEVTMSGLVRKSFDTPDETRPFEGDTGQFQLVTTLDHGAVGRATFLPGWRWSEHVRPIAKTDSCQATHVAYFVSGRMKVVMDDGEEMEYGPGDFAMMAPGHDAWTLGDEPCVLVDWGGYADYAKR